MWYMYGVFVHVLLSTHIHKHTYTHARTHTHTHTHTHTSNVSVWHKYKTKVCARVYVCLCVCLLVFVSVCVLLSNKYHIKSCFSDFFHLCPHKLIVLLLKLSWRFLRWIQKVAQMGFCLAALNVAYKLWFTKVNDMI